MGALIVEWLKWGYIFSVTCGATLLVLLLSCALVPETKLNSGAKLDVFGSSLIALASGCLVFSLIEGPVLGWTTATTTLGFACGLIGAAAFVTWSLRASHPVLDVRLFGNRAVSTGAASIFIQWLTFYGLAILLVQYSPYILGFSPIKTGLLFFPEAIPIVPAALAAPHLSARFGRGAVGGVGIIVAATGLCLLGAIGNTGRQWGILVCGLAMVGLGLGLALTPATESIVESLPKAEQGVASAMNDIIREFSATLGVAFCGSIFNTFYRSYVTQHLSTLAPSEIRTITSSPGAGLDLASTLKGGPSRTTDTLIREAFMSGWSAAIWAVVVVSVVVAVFVVIATPRQSSAPIHIAATP
jgi:MFS family permease